MVSRVYVHLRQAAERFGGSMQWEPAGSPHGSWFVRLGRWSRSFASTGGSFPGLDELYVPIRQPPRNYQDYSQDLIPGAIASFASSVVDRSERSPRSWTAEEVECLVFCYFWMLDEEEAGRSFKKAALFKSLADGVLTVNRRSAKAAERKSMNVSAVLDEVGVPFVKGLLPDRHYQGFLRKRVLAELHRRKLVDADDFEPTGDRELRNVSMTLRH